MPPQPAAAADRHAATIGGIRVCGMSDNWITLIPDNPRFVPDLIKQAQARERFAEIAPAADSVEIKVCQKVEFFDCGGNFERILCPSCRLEIPVRWWQLRMEQDYSDGFMLGEFRTPCCTKPVTLNDLIYEWPQGFARFALDAMNPRFGMLDEKYKEELERILGTNLRVIYQHL